MNPDPATYAAFRLRFRALRIDATILLGLFLIGAILAGIVLENHPEGRIGAFAVILGVMLGYEPFMVARYGGTIGHRKSNIRIVCDDSDDFLPFWRAAIRSLVKQSVGLISLAFMFLTRRAQGLHDLASGARVILRDPLIAVDDDRFAPSESWLGRRVNRLGESPTH